MKKSDILLQADKINSGEILKRARSGNVLRYFLFAVVLSCMTLLSACAVEYRTPYHREESFGVIVEPWDYQWRHEHHEWIHEHPHWRHEYPRHHDDDDD